MKKRFIDEAGIRNNFLYLSFTVIYSYSSSFFIAFGKNHIYVDYTGAGRTISGTSKEKRP